MRGKWEQAVEALGQLAAKEEAIMTLAERIEAVEADVVSQSGNGNRREEELCALIDCKDRLVRRKKALELQVKQTRRALAGLEETQRTVLELMYCRGLKPGEAVLRLERELHAGQATIYRLREWGLMAFSCRMGWEKQK